MVIALSPNWHGNCIAGKMARLLLWGILMSLIHADGFDHYGGDKTALLSLYSGYGNPARWGFAGGIAGMTGDACIFFADTTGAFQYPFAAATNTTIVGWRMKCVSLGAQFVILMTSVGAQQYTFSVNNRSGVDLKSGATVLASSADNIIAANSAFYAEMKLTAHATNGVIEVRVNNALVITVSGLVVPDKFEVVYFSDAAGGQWYMDDFYVCDSYGATHNDFLGDRQMITTYATADEAGNQWTLTGGATGFEILDNVPPNDAAYIAGATAGDISEFSHGTVASTAISIAGVVMFARCSKSDAGGATMGVGLESNGFSDYDTEITPSVGFGYYKRIIELDPDGDVPWTYAKFNASKLRVERIS